MRKNTMEFLIVGCGLTGSVIARYLAEKGHQLTIWERRNHIGGNMYDYVDKNGVRVHQYGPHVFHTYDKELRDYMLQFGKWESFRITCRVEMLGKVTPSPFNYQTIDDYYTQADASALKKSIENKFHGRDKATIVELLSSSDEAIRQYAEFLFAHDYSLYTAKQWGVSPQEIDPSVLKRVPVLFSYKDGYFDDTWQMVPQKGYTDWFYSVLRHSKIEVQLGVEALEHLSIQNDSICLDEKPYSGTVIYTGAIDELFGLCDGALPYRSLRFQWKTKPCDHYQSAALVAYPEAKGYTRITDYSYFPQERKTFTSSVAYEYPQLYTPNTDKEPYYPILTEQSIALHRQYLNKLAKIKNIIPCGRLADFQYYNMDQALTRALEVCKQL